MINKNYIRIFFLFKFFLFGIFHITPAQTNIILEAENATLLGTAQLADCNNASGGKMVKNLEDGENNALLVQDITINEEGDYFIKLCYYSANERNFTYKINEEAGQTNSIPSSGLWCYQGGIPGEFVFKESFVEGKNNLKFYNSPIIDKIEIVSDTASRQASTIYLSSSLGNNNNNGLNPASPFQTLDQLNSLSLVHGDSIFFMASDTFTGKLSIINEGGSEDKPIIISSYGTGAKPVIDGDGYLSAIHVVNSGYLYLKDLEITNNGGSPQSGEPTDLRYGIYIQNTLTDGTYFKNYRIKNITFKNIFPTIEVTDDDNTGVNAHAITTSGSWGDELHPTRFEDMIIENCLFTRTARHAVVLKAINKLEIKHNLFEHVGGAGMMIGNNCTNILVERNITDHTGSKIDPRMAGRGSGIWCYRTKNLTVQHNKFMHARGIHDSYGMHIDIGNENVIYQYNYSENNEGGFVEILGANKNVGYRYNLSIGDGWRKRGNRHGQVFWFSGWSGDPQNPIGSEDIFVYNNSIYVRDSITPGIFIASVTKNSKIYNNIIYVDNEFGPITIQNSPSFNDFDHNIWFGNISDTDENALTYRGANAKTSDPLFLYSVVVDSSGFVLQTGSPALGTGKLVANNGGKDYFGNHVSASELPNIGAYNGNAEDTNSAGIIGINHFNIYPNPIRRQQPLVLEIPNQLSTQENTMKIIDITGKVWFKNTFKYKNKIIVDINRFPKGIYFLHLKSASFSTTKQFIVQ